MQDKIELDLAPDVPEISTMHLLPCQIKEPCTGPIKEYFVSQIKSEDNHLAVSFRGRALKGTVVELPSQMRGYMCRLDNTEDGGKEFVGLSQFKRFTYWNHDTIPSKTDTPQRLIEYIRVLNVMNGRHEDKK